MYVRTVSRMEIMPLCAHEAGDQAETRAKSLLELRVVLQDRCLRDSIFFCWLALFGIGADVQ